MHTTMQVNIKVECMNQRECVSQRECMSMYYACAKSCMSEITDRSHYKRNLVGVTRIFARVKPNRKL